MSIYLAKKFLFIHVYAIEPDPENYGCLKRNIARNGVTNVTVINKAISGDGHKRILYSRHGDSGWATINTRMTSAPQVFRAGQVDTVILNQLFRDGAIAHCRLLKSLPWGLFRNPCKNSRGRGALIFFAEKSTWRIVPRQNWNWLVGESLASIFGERSLGKPIGPISAGCSKVHPGLSCSKTG
jgi:FkbM family methyltransferase